MDIRVQLQERSYQIRIGIDVLKALPEALLTCGLSKTCVIVTHPRLFDLYGSLLAASLGRFGFSVTPILVPEGETTKNLDCAKMIYSKMVQCGCDRHSFVIALGGGVVGDLAGFVAGTYMRGIPFVQVPTTLLAQVDASIGGKVAVDLPEGKNLVGLFYQPALVYIDVATLKSLPQREFIGGLAEVIKYGCIGDGELFDFLEMQADAVLRMDQSSLHYMIERSCAAKARIVSEDEKESGLRAILNFGHTIGHAIESASGYHVLSHGEAVAIGMKGAALISHRMGLTTEEDVLRLDGLLERYTLPRSFSKPDPETVATYLWSDKKKKEGKLRWVLLHKIGEVSISHQVEMNEVLEVLKELYLPLS
ncbi:MAG: 3-dehydroquinate synthase [Chlamydiota bacterium]|nr:3-dehydroquinate synthase [Chlamydiota bacterium]